MQGDTVYSGRTILALLFYPEDGGSTFLLIVRKFLAECKAGFFMMAPREPQVSRQIKNVLRKKRERDIWSDFSSTNVRLSTVFSVKPFVFGRSDNIYTAKTIRRNVNLLQFRQGSNSHRGSRWRSSLRHYATNRMVAGSIPKSFQPHYGPGVDSDSNRNGYHESFWG
jgi:hypothetical protein